MYRGRYFFLIGEPGGFLNYGGVGNAPSRRRPRGFYTYAEQGNAVHQGTH